MRIRRATTTPEGTARGRKGRRLRPAACVALILALPATGLAADRPPARAADARRVVDLRLPGCGTYGTYDCQFVPHISGDDRPGPVYGGGPRCIRRWTPLGTRRLCRAF